MNKVLYILHIYIQVVIIGRSSKDHSGRNQRNIGWTEYNTRPKELRVTDQEEWNRNRENLKTLTVAVKTFRQF